MDIDDILSKIFPFAEKEEVEKVKVVIPCALEGCFDPIEQEHQIFGGAVVYMGRWFHKDCLIEYKRRCSEKAKQEEAKK